MRCWSISDQVDPAHKEVSRRIAGCRSRDLVEGWMAVSEDLGCRPPAFAGIGPRTRCSDFLSKREQDGLSDEIAWHVRMKDSQVRGVREGGVEPPRPFGHRVLNPARLPFRHSRARARLLPESRSAPLPPLWKDEPPWPPDPPSTALLHRPRTPRRVVPRGSERCRVGPRARAEPDDFASASRVPRDRAGETSDARPQPRKSRCRRRSRSIALGMGAAG